MEYMIGLVLSLAGIGTATVIGLGRERAFYPTLLIKAMPVPEDLRHLLDNARDVGGKR